MACPAIFFRAVHCRVSITENILRIVVAGCAQSNADARCRVDLMSVEIERLSHLLLGALGHPNCMIVIFNTVDKNGKLVTTQPYYGVRRPGTLFQTSGDSYEQLIPSDVTQGVINVLEAIKVEEEQGEQVIGFEFCSI